MRITDLRGVLCKIDTPGSMNHVSLAFWRFWSLLQRRILARYRRRRTRGYIPRLGVVDGEYPGPPSSVMDRLANPPAVIDFVEHCNQIALMER